MTLDEGDPSIEAAWRLAVEYAEEGNHEVIEALRTLPTCELCREVGHIGQDCPKKDDYDIPGESESSLY